MTDRVTLYRVRRPDGTVHALFSNQERLDSAALNHLIENDGYTIEAVEYAPVNPEREAAIREMREGLADCLAMIENCPGPCGSSNRDIGPRYSLAAFDKADGAK